MIQLGRSPVSLSDLVTAGLLRPGKELSFRNGTRPAQATSAGTLTFEGRDFTGLSTAARAASGTSTNGWLAWHVDHDGRCVTLADLGDRFLKR